MIILPLFFFLYFSPFFCVDKWQFSIYCFEICIYKRTHKRKIYFRLKSNVCFRLIQLNILQFYVEHLVLVFFFAFSHSIFACLFVCAWASLLMCLPTRIFYFLLFHNSHFACLLFNLKKNLFSVFELRRYSKALFTIF